MSIRKRVVRRLRKSFRESGLNVEGVRGPYYEQLKRYREIYRTMISPGNVINDLVEACKNVNFDFESSSCNELVFDFPDMEVILEPEK